MVSFARINPSPLTTYDRLGNPAALATRPRGGNGENMGSVPRFSKYYIC
jgi:hypothetical protein